MPFDDDVRELKDDDELTPAAAKLRKAHPQVSSLFAWLPPRLWTCPGCSSTALTRDAAPRCARCGFREGT